MMKYHTITGGTNRIKIRCIPEASPAWHSVRKSTKKKKRGKCRIEEKYANKMKREIETIAIC